MVRLMRNLRAAIIFLTRVPVPMQGEPSLTAAVPWFPVAGAFVGVAVGASAAGLEHVVPPLVAAAVAVLVGVLITGAFHEDGLADVADAFAGGWTRQERLRILDDPLHGSYGVAALCGSIVVRVACLASLGFAPAAAFASAIAAHTLGRGAAVGLMATVPVARPDGLGAEYAKSLSRQRAAAGAIGALAITAIAVGWWVGPFLVAAAVGAGAVGWLTIRKLGGVTGDVLGAAEQVVECIVLITATALATRYQLWWRG
jgi:adenosylcobinamide-GDP ribazoletransferase